MRSQIKLGQIFGIRIGLHYSWFLIALLITFSLYADLHIKHPDWNTGFILELALVTALLFFVSLLLHELAHSLVARSQGIPVREITLFALGGVSQIEREASTAKDEFWIAIVGPLTSAVIGLVCYGIVHAAQAGPALSAPMAMLAWLAYINLALAVFNLIPGYPMDGGRILRALLWWRSGNLERATRAASRIGQGIAILFIAFGVFEFFMGGSFGGLWIAFIGWFLLQAARETYLELGLKRQLAGVRVADVMTRQCPTVDGSLTIQDFVEHTLLPSGRRCFLVKDPVRGVSGLITPHEIKHIERSLWPITRLDSVMGALDKLHTVAPETPLLDALQVMGSNDLNQLPVVSGGHIEGLISRDRILSYLHTRMELQPTEG